jgi:hypothetical protein
MAQLVPGTDLIRVWADGQAEHVVLYALRGVTAGDTVDLSAEFNPPLRGALVGITVNGVISADFAGNTCTIPGGNNDAAYLLVFGVHA